MTTVLFERTGQVRLSQVAPRPPAPGEVSVAVAFAGVNPTDTYHRRRVTDGSDELLRVPGVEVSGVVTAVGEGARWSVGDRVFGLVHDGGLSSVVNADGELLVATPAVLDDEQASAVPEVFITAHDGIAQGALVSGETLLVTGATGAVGLAAVQIGRERGARVLGISRSERGDAMLRSLNAEPFPDHGGVDGLANLAYRDSVDVVLELVGARNARGDLAALRPKGRMVFVAAQGNEDICFNLRDFKTKRAVLLGSTLRRRGRQAKIEAVRAFEKEVVPLLAEGAVKPTISKVFPVDEAQAAFDYMSTPGRLGKVLLAF